MPFLGRLRSRGSRSDPEYLFLVAPPTAGLHVAYSRGDDGTLFFAAFTSEAAVLRWVPEGGQLASARLSTMRAVMANSPIETLVINPGGPDQRILGIDDLPRS